MSPDISSQKAGCLRKPTTLRRLKNTGPLGSSIFRTLPKWRRQKFTALRGKIGVTSRKVALLSTTGPVEKRRKISVPVAWEIPEFDWLKFRGERS